MDSESSKACISSLLSASKLLNEVMSIMAHEELVKWVSFSCQDIMWAIEQSVSAVEASHLYLEAIAPRRTAGPSPVMREIDNLGELYYMFANYILYEEPECFKLLNAVSPLRKAFAFYKQHRADPHTMFFENESLWIYLCRGPFCTKAQPGRSLPFKRCSGCRRATYCLQQCQRNAWRFPTAPYREICTSLWALCQSVNAWTSTDAEEKRLATFKILISRNQAIKGYANLLALRKTQHKATSTYIFLMQTLFISTDDGTTVNNIAETKATRAIEDPWGNFCSHPPREPQWTIAEGQFMP
jgi:hypothetical protein